jgi:hypothetical protein
VIFHSSLLTSDHRVLLFSRCPEGAQCLGHTFPPIARRGYGQLTVSSERFFECRGYERCLSAGDTTCDCLGGEIIDADTIVTRRCAHGYLNLEEDSHSPLCSKCLQTANYAARQGSCEVCGLSGAAYLVISLLVILLWFPITSNLTEKFESLEITLGLVQFLGLYSMFDVKWPEPLQSLLNACSFFNLDVNMMHLACFRPLSKWQSLWIVQTFLPIVYLPLCGVHLFVEWVLMHFAKNDLPPARFLLRSGWRPRLEYSLKSLRDSYLPKAALFMHVYCIVHARTRSRTLQQAHSR